MAALEPLPDLTAEEATALTARIKESAEQLWNLLLEAHDGRAWAALGYPTWSAYTAAEFDMTKNYANRLVRHARFVGELTEVAGEVVPMGTALTERATRDLSDEQRADVIEQMRERMADSPSLTDLIADALAEVREEGHGEVVPWSVIEAEAGRLDQGFVASLVELGLTSDEAHDHLLAVKRGDFDGPAAIPAELATEERAMAYLNGVDCWDDLDADGKAERIGRYEYVIENVTTDGLPWTPERFVERSFIPKSALEWFRTP